MYDLAVIGLGPGGMEAINIALKNNLKVIAFEKEHVGGCCLNVGCIPTKAILHSALSNFAVSSFNNIGLNLDGNINTDWSKILSRKDDIVSKFKKGATSALEKNITLIKSNASLAKVGDDIVIKADSEIYQAKNIIVSSGSIARELPNLKFNGDNILSSDDLYNLEKLPNSIAIVGSGAIGVEWGVIFASLGVEVTIIEKMPLLSPNMDIEVSKRLDRILKSYKIKCFKDDYIVDYSNSKVTLNSGAEFSADKILVAVGRKPIMPESDFEITINKDNHKETNYNNLFVIGDATGYGMLAHSASYDARNVMNKILFNKNFSTQTIPAVIYIHPEIATVGIKEQDIDDSFQIKKLPLVTSAKAWADDATDGIIKLIIKDNLIKGATVISNEASSLIAIIKTFIDFEIPLDKIEDFIFPHPSYSELISEVLKRG